MNCGRSSSVEWKLPKLQRRVRFPSPAPPPPGCAPGGFVMPPRQARLASHALFYLPLAPSRSLVGAHPVQNSPSTPGSAAHPIQNSPSTPQNADFRPFCTSRENFVSHAGPIPVQNSPRTHPSRQYRYKILPANTPCKPTRYKTLPARPKTLILAHFAPAGRTLYRSHHQQVEQGEKSHAPTPHLTHQCAPPSIPHAIRLRELSTKPRNVAIPTM